MAYLLKTRKRDVLLASFGKLKLVWFQIPQYITSNDIPLPAPPKGTDKDPVYNNRLDTSLICFGKTNVGFDKRETQDVLDDIRKKLCR